MKRNSYLAVLLAVAAMFAGCTGIFGKLDSSDGLVRLSLSAGQNARTILPGTVDLADLNDYILFGSKDGAEATQLAEINDSLDGATVALKPGVWKFTLQAFSGYHYEVLEGSLSLTVTAQTTNLAFVLSPLQTETGVGTVWVRVFLPEGHKVASAETLFGGKRPGAIDAGINTSNNYYNLLLNSVASGDYVLLVKMKSAEGEVLYTLSELVRVRDNLCSTEQYSPKLAELRTGTPPKGITATIDMGSEAAIAFSEKNEVTLGTDLTVSVTNTYGTGNYLWSLDVDQPIVAETSSSITLPTTGLALGPHQLTVVVTSDSEQTSKTLTFTVVVAPTVPKIRAVGTYYDTKDRAVSWSDGVPTELLIPAGTAIPKPTTSIVVNGNSYIAGTVHNSSGAVQAGYWLNGTWNFLPSLVDYYGSGATGIAVSSTGDVYVCGYSYSSDGYSKAGYWRGGIWVDLPMIDSGRWGQASSIQIVNDHVYISGYTDDGGNYMCYWLDGKRTDCPEGATQTVDYGAPNLLVTGGQVYVIGTCTPGGQVIKAGYMDTSGTWTNLGPEGQKTNATAVTTVSGKVYVGGVSIDAQGYHAVYWVLGQQNMHVVGTSNCWVYSMYVSGSDVYLAGHSANTAGFWKDSGGTGTKLTWTALTTPTDSSLSIVTAGFVP